MSYTHIILSCCCSFSVPFSTLPPLLPPPIVPFTRFSPCPPTPQGKGPLFLQWGGRCCLKLFLLWLLSALADKQGLWSADPQPAAPLLCSKTGWLASRGCPGLTSFCASSYPFLPSSLGAWGPGGPWSRAVGSAYSFFPGCLDLHPISPASPSGFRT